MCNALKDHVAKVEENLQRGKYYDFILKFLYQFMVYNQPCQSLFSFFYALAGQIYILTEPCHVGMEGIPR